MIFELLLLLLLLWIAVIQHFRLKLAAVSTEIQARAFEQLAAPSVCARRVNVSH